MVVMLYELTVLQRHHVHVYVFSVTVIGVAILKLVLGHVRYHCLVTCVLRNHNNGV